jgi:hypothetical protein
LTRSGTQPTNAILGVVIHATAHEGLLVQTNGKRVRLAIIDDDGNVLVAGSRAA